MTIKAPMTQLVELIVTTGLVGANTPIYFQQQPQLQSTSGNQTVYIRALETFTSEDMSGSPITTGNPVATPAQLVNATLTLNIAGTLKFQNIPLGSLHRTWNTETSVAPKVMDLFTFRNIWEVNWTKSYVTLINSPAGLPYSYLFNVFYSYDPDPTAV